MNSCMVKIPEMDLSLDSSAASSIQWLAAYCWAVRQLQALLSLHTTFQHTFLNRQPLKCKKKKEAYDEMEAELSR
jgi:hypothetical protein